MDKRIPFSLDRHDKKILGVCSGLGRTLNVDPTFIRVAFVAIPLLTFVTFWQAFIVYLMCGAAGAFARGRQRRRSGSDLQRMDHVAPRRGSIHDMRTKFDETDRRLMAIDHHLNSHNSDALAREIEALRQEKEEQK